jgi:hypothetical protein
MDRDTRNPFIITAVVMCSVTCLVVFNLNWISDDLARKYYGAKKKKPARDAAALRKKDEPATRMVGPNDGVEAV